MKRMDRARMKIGREIEKEPEPEPEPGGLGEAGRLIANEGLASAILLDDPQAVALCVSSGARVDALHKGGLSLAALAARVDALLALETLLELGAAPTAVCADGREPVHVCCFYGRAGALERLLVAGASPNALDSCGQPALHMAIERQELSCSEVLLSAGANPNQTNQFGETPLSLAIKRHDLAALSALLAKGADPRDAGGGKESPLAVCARLAEMSAGANNFAPKALAQLERAVIRGASESTQSVKRGRSL